MEIIKHGKIKKRMFACVSCGCEFIAEIGSFAAKVMSGVAKTVGAVAKPIIATVKATAKAVTDTISTTVKFVSASIKTIGKVVAAGVGAAGEFEKIRYTNGFCFIADVLNLTLAHTLCTNKTMPPWFNVIVFEGRVACNKFEEKRRKKELPQELQIKQLFEAMFTVE